MKFTGSIMFTIYELENWDELGLGSDCNIAILLAQTLKLMKENKELKEQIKNKEYGIDKKPNLDDIIRILRLAGING